jgi:hypothetical protein
MNPTIAKLIALYGEDLADGMISIRGVMGAAGCTLHQAHQASIEARKKRPPGTWRVVVAGDLHFCPHHAENSRKVAKAFGQFITAQGRAAMRNREKFVAVSIGDAADFASLSSYDKGRRAFEGRELRADFEEVNRCIALVSEHIENDVWAYMARRPFVTSGNHEERVLRVEESDREFSGTFGIGYDEHRGRPINLEWQENGWAVYPFLRPAFVDDVAFMHYLPSPKTGRAIASVNQGRALLMSSHQSIIVGHSHEWRTGRLLRLDGSKLVATVVGCSFLDDHAYAGHIGNLNYDRGFTVLRGLKGSEYTPQFLPFSEVFRYLESRGFKKNNKQG